MKTRFRDRREDARVAAAFRSADGDGPSATAEAALLAALGISAATTIAAPAAAATAAGAAAGAGTTGAGTTGAGTAAGGAIGAGAGSVAPAGAGVAAKIGGMSMLAKWAAGSVLVVSGSIAATNTFVEQPGAPMAMSAPAAARPIESARAARMAAPVAAPAMIEEAPRKPADAPAIAMPRGMPTAPAPHAERRARATEGPEPSAMSHELASLSRARSLITSGRATEALAVLATYDATFPHGVMAQEAEALRVDALVQAGDIDEARSRARAFLATHPESPHAPRMRALAAAPSE